MGLGIARWVRSWWLPSSLKLLLPLENADLLEFQEPVRLVLSLWRIVVPGRPARNHVP
jgi:hypothetical protein